MSCCEGDRVESQRKWRRSVIDVGLKIGIKLSFFKKINQYILLLLALINSLILVWMNSRLSLNFHAVWKRDCLFYSWISFLPPSRATYNPYTLWISGWKVYLIQLPPCDELIFWKSSQNYSLPNVRGFLLCKYSFVEKLHASHSAKLLANTTKPMQKSRWHSHRSTGRMVTGSMPHSHPFPDLLHLSTQ